jgi:hypothetical protein
MRDTMGLQTLTIKLINHTLATGWADEHEKSPWNDAKE